jgi:hypothetical protein
MGIHKYVEALIGSGMVQEVACCGPTDAPEQSDANAAFIVRACNSHHDLLNALECLLIGACAVGVPHAGERAVLQEAVDIARAAIAKATQP